MTTETTEKMTRGERMERLELLLEGYSPMLVELFLESMEEDTTRAVKKAADFLGLGERTMWKWWTGEGPVSGPGKLAMLGWLMLPEEERERFLELREKILTR